MNASSRPHAVILGAGIFGVSTAVHLLRLGAAVTLVTQGVPGDGASGRSLSWLNSARRRSAAYHGLRIAGIDRYRTLAARHPEARWLRFDGGLTWDADTPSNEIAEVHEHERSLGYDSHLLSPEAAAALVPGVDVRAIAPQGAIFNPGEGWVDLPSLITLLLQEFRAGGGVLVQQAGAHRVIITGGRATGVAPVSGPAIGGDAVVVATGPAAPQMLAEAGLAIPDASPVSLLVRSKPVQAPLRAVLNTPRVAIRPAPGGALVFDSGWAEEEVAQAGVQEATLHGLLREASAVLADHPRLEVETYGTGLKPVPGDGEPVVGRLEGIAGYHVLFSHSGATLGLILGELLAAEIVTGRGSPLLASFRPGRFAEAGLPPGVHGGEYAEQDEVWGVHAAAAAQPAARRATCR